MTDRAALTAALSDQWDALDRLVAGLDENHWRIPSPLPGWTVFDVFAHVVGTESILLGEPIPQADAEVSEQPHVRNPTGAMNEAWVDSLRPLSGEQLLATFHDVIDRRRKALAAFTDEKWERPGPSPIGEVSYGRFMRIRQFDCWMHELDIADALGVSVDEGGPRAEFAFGELIPTLGRAAVKGAQAPDGSRIAFDLTGPAARQVRLAVDGRAELVDEFDAPATVDIAMSSGLFARLRGGRTTAGEHSGEISLGGDSELGRRLVDNLRFTM